MSGTFIVGLDIGSQKVCAVVAASHGNGVRVVGAGEAPARGLKAGMVVDMEAATLAVREALAEAERTSGVKIRAVYAAIAGSHVRCSESTGAAGVKRGEVTWRDMERAVQSAANLYVPLNRELLHALPVSYALDGQGDIVRPLGMRGVRLEARVMAITAAQAAVENMLGCCEGAGVEVIEAVFGPLAASHAVLREAEREAGVLLIDVGAGTTDVALFKGGTLRHAFSIPVAGSHLTGDLAIGLRISREEAERVKHEEGFALPAGAGQSGATIKVHGLEGERRTIPRNYMGEILLPRCEEIFELLRDGLGDPLLYTCSVAVLTGGSAVLPAMDRVLEAVLGITVRTGVPEGPPAQGLEGPAYATALGLMLYGNEVEAQPPGGVLTTAGERLRQWMENLFDARTWARTGRTPGVRYMKS
ncbi:MAG: cell division protein FtsA [Nitrospirota bacterium]|jgi:cell division protein FtsA